VLSVFIWLTSAQYAAPVLRNSLDKIAVLDFTSIIERIMKLSTISLVIWLAGFYALFQSLLNALAEIMRFGDREFYSDWWNSWSVGMYWRSWNKPVYLFMKRHIFSPLVGRGWSPFAASIMVFLFSAILHELLVGIPTHNLIGRSIPHCLEYEDTDLCRRRICRYDVSTPINHRNSTIRTNG
jgi:diacylglycerol O-acyltransferase-1